MASAITVSDGFTDSVRGTSDASPTNSRFTSCDSALRSTTERAGSSPIRHEPWTWVDASPDQHTRVAPAASSTSRLKRSPASIRPRSAGVSSTSNRSPPPSSTTTAEALSSFAIASTPAQYRNLRTASTRRSPHIGPSSSQSVAANAIGSWIVVASITNPPSSSCWCSMQCAVIG